MVSFLIGKKESVSWFYGNTLLAEIDAEKQLLNLPNLHVIV
tara:strand:+ start:2447 stop:2569 length:123 start_codon:yes stop_codon:yes gene_type:complete